MTTGGGAGYSGPLQAMTTLTIAHISDLHLRSALPGTSSVSRRLSRRVPGLLAEAVRRIGDAAPDLVVVTGDLVDHPLYDLRERRLAAAGERDLALVRDLFAPLRCPVVPLFGNHDQPALFRRVFGPQPVDFDVKGWRILVFNDEEVDCHVPQRMGQERERFLAALRDGDPRPQVHLQHYLIAPDRSDGYPHNYGEAESLEQALVGDGRVRLALSGHYHRGEALLRRGGAHFAVAPAFAEPPHPYRVFELSDAGITQTDCALRPADARGLRQPAVFVDRDGTINPQPSYRTGPEPFCLIDGAAAALRGLAAAGFALVVVSNQTAVGLGVVTVDQVAATNDRMAALLAARGVELDGVYCTYETPRAVLPRHRTQNPRTKPDPAMLRAAADDLHRDLSRSFIVGDRRSDIEAGANAGCRAGVLVRTGDGRDEEARLGAVKAHHVANDLAAAAAWILAQR